MDKLLSLSIEALTTLRAEKRAAFEALVAKDAPTQDEFSQATALADDLDKIGAEFTRRNEQTAQWATLRTRSFADEPEVIADKNEALEGQGEEGENKVIAEPSEVNENTEKGASGTAQHEENVQEPLGQTVEPGNVVDGEGNQVPNRQTEARGGVATLAAKTARPVAPANVNGPVTITAAANVEGFATGQRLDLTEVAKAVISRARGFAPPTGDGTRQDLQKFGTARFNLDFPEDLIVDRGTDIDEVLKRATDEHRLAGGSLTAAGGWCAPSETVYDLTQDATNEGMLSLPEINVRRGGIRYANSPTFADFYANPGFIQTEAQAIAGTVKPCVEVDCPDFTEVRMDVEGLCIKVPILTNVGYPEYVRNFVEGTLIAHQHWINANIIQRLVTFAGAPRVLTGMGSTFSDTLGGLELLAEQRRQKYRLSMNRTMEVVVPFWVRSAIRQDLANRGGFDNAQAVSDAQIGAYFRARKLNVQWVYDWQPLPEVDNAATTGVNEANVYPGTFSALMYPAGTFVKGTQDVINLSTVYDAASLAVNVYTGLFTEQGLLVAKMKHDADLVTIPVCNAGRTGAANITC